MKRAIIHKANGYWYVTVRNGDKTIAHKIVGKATDKAGDIMKLCVAQYGLDQIGVRASDIGQATANSFNPTVWMKPGWQG